MGEMERDSIIAHGASNFLLDRLLYNSDAYRMFVCSKCGNSAIPPSKLTSDSSKRSIPRCSNKKCKGLCVSVQIPYASKIFFNEISGLHINAKFKV